MRRRKWIPFGRHIMIAVKQQQQQLQKKKTKLGEEGGAGWARDTTLRDRLTDVRRTGGETPAVASPTVIIVLTFKWRTSTMVSRLRQQPVCK